MARIVIKDPDHPDFPHGEERGYGRGCHRECCRTAKSRRNAERKAGEKSVKVPTGRSVRHIQTLSRIPGFTWARMSAISGVNEDTLHYVLHIGCVTSAEIEARILAVTGQQIRPPVIERPRREAIRMLRAVQAHGWPTVYIADQIGLPGWHGTFEELVGVGPEVSPGRWQAIQALYRSHEARPGPSDKSRRLAREAGYFPPTCYDEDGRYVPGSARPPGYKGTDEEQVGTRWAVLRMILALHTVGEITERLGVNEKQVDRVKDRWGIRLGPDAALYGLIPARQRPLLRILREAVAEVDLLVVDPKEHERETAERVAAWWRSQPAWRRAQRSRIKAGRQHLTVAVRRQRTLTRERDVRPVAA